MKRYTIASVLFLGLILFATNASAKHIRIFVIGDSIVQTYSPSQYPLTGWGQLLPRLFNDDVQVINCAIGGRSSKSFIGEKRWDKIMKQLKPGDYVFMQWGHNDQYPHLKKRYTDPDTTFKTYLKRYINDTRSKKAIPVFIVMPVRGFAFKHGTYKNSHVQTRSKMPKDARATDTPYTDSARAVAKEEKTLTIDLHKMSLNYFKKLPYKEIQTYFMKFPANTYFAYPKGKKDLEHFQFKGAALLTHFIAITIRKFNDPLSHYLKSEAAIKESLKDNHLHKKAITIKKVSNQFDFTLSDWKPSGSDIKIIKGENGILKLEYTIDHHQKGADSEPLKGWPRAIYKFNNTIQLSSFNYLVFDVKIKSNRPDSSLGTVMTFSFRGADKSKTELGYNLRGDTAKWRRITIPIKQILGKACSASMPLVPLKTMQLIISEELYKDKTTLNVEIKHLKLIKTK